MKKPNPAKTRLRLLGDKSIAIVRGGVRPIPGNDPRYRPEPTGEGDEQH